MHRRQLMLGLAGAAISAAALGRQSLAPLAPESRYRITGPGHVEVWSEGGWVKSIRVHPAWRVALVRESGLAASLRVDAPHCRFMLHTEDGLRWSA